MIVALGLGYGRHANATVQSDAHGAAGSAFSIGKSSTRIDDERVIAMTCNVGRHDGMGAGEWNVKPPSLLTLVVIRGENRASNFATHPRIAAVV